MRFSPSFLDELKARLPVSEVVRRRVKLVKSGREWKGLSPFNNEKTPSFFVNDQKMAWFDFSSGKNGNIFDFVMATEGLGFPEAVERLAQDAGLPLPAFSPENEAREKVRADLHEVLAHAAVFFETQLRGQAGAKARAYLAERQLGAELQSKFRLGYAPAEKYALRDALAGKGASVETMIEAGLLIHGEDIAVPYDRFRDRVMFPICDRNGQVIAFGGRALDKAAPAKYLNSPETPLFHKGAVLYNHHNARKAAHETGTVIAVEGYVDVISLSGVGFAHVVAPLGTALTADQCRLLWQMAEEPILCFDGDRAGRKAAYRAIDTALPLLGAGKSLRFALLPDGIDPDDLARTGGTGAVTQIMSNAQPLVDLLWAREAEARPLSTPEQRFGFERRLNEAVRAIGDETLRRYYQAEFRNRLAGLFAPSARSQASLQGSFQGRSEIRSRGGHGASPAGGWRSQPFSTDPRGIAASPLEASPRLSRTAVFQPGQGRLSPREALILLLLANHPIFLELYAEDIAELELESREAQGFRDALLDLFARGAAQDHATLREGLSGAGLDSTLAKLERISVPASHWYSRPEAATSDAEEVLKQALALHRKTKALHRELQLAELALGNEASEVNFARLKDIQDQLAALAGTEAAVEGFGAMSGRPSGSL